MLPAISEHDLIWMAGLMEGEASFYPGSPNGASSNLPWVALKMTDRDVVDRVGRLWGVSTMTERRPDPKHKDAYTIRARGRRAVIIMWLVLPYMGRRRARRIREVLDTAAFHKSGPRKVPEVVATADDFKGRRPKS